MTSAFGEVVDTAGPGVPVQYLAPAGVADVVLDALFHLVVDLPFEVDAIPLLLAQLAQVGVAAVGGIVARPPLIAVLAVVAVSGVAPIALGGQGVLESAVHPLQ